MLWKNLKSSANKTQLELPSESQTALIHTLINQAKRYIPLRTPKLLVYERKRENTRKMEMTFARR